MFRRVLRFAVALALAACKSTPLESVFVPLPDPSSLEVGHAADAAGETIVEYVPVGEKIESWRHLVTIQFLEGERRTPEALVAALEQWTRGHGGTLEWNVLERDANSVLYEWRLLDCPKADATGLDPYADQCEISRVLRGNDGLHRVAYTERTRAMDADSRAKFLEAFRKAYVVKGPERERVEVR